MKNKIKKIIACCLSFALLGTSLQIGAFANVQSTDTDMFGSYQHLTEIPEDYTGIYTVDDLEKVRENPTGNYILMNNIQFSGGGFSQIGGSNQIESNFFPMYIFSGVFDGNGYTISNMYSYGGLFQNIYGSVKNLSVNGVVVSDTNNSIGGIVDNLSSGTIENCQFDGQVILNYNSWNFYERFAVGGIVGTVNSGQINNCANYGDVAVSYDQYEEISFETPVYLGGISGYWSGTQLAFPQIENCANYGNIILAVDCPATVGGILGYGFDNYGFEINSCFNAGSLYVSQSENASGKEVVTGGVVGTLIGPGAKITNVFNTGYWDISVLSDLCVGGIVGSLEKVSLIGAYNTSTIFHGEAEKIGGIVGRIDEESSMEAVYFSDLYPSARTDATAIDGQRTLEELRLSSTYGDYCFLQGDWKFDEEATYPYPQLSENLYKAFRFGSGTEEDPYQVRNMQELNAVRYQLSAHFLLTQDIACTNYNGYSVNTTHPVLIVGYTPKWYPIGQYTVEGFSGVFDGNCHTISGIYTSWNDEDYVYDSVDGGDFYPTKCYMGLFGYNQGLIQNLSLSFYINADSIFDNSLTGRSFYDTAVICGSVAGLNSGTIRRCSSYSNINSVLAGGIVGENSGVIEQSFCNEYVLASVTAGGITALNYGTIRQCANTGSYISKRGNWDFKINDSTMQGAGGIAGYNTNLIENCYNTAPILSEMFDTYSHFAAGIAVGGRIENCYNLGQVSLPKSGVLGTGYPIGGKNTINVYSWNIDDQTDNESCHTYEEMTRQDTYVDFDFDNVWEISLEKEYPFPVLRNTEIHHTNQLVGMVLIEKPSRHVFTVDEPLRNTISGNGKVLLYYTDGTTKSYKYTDASVLKYDESIDGFEYLATLGSVGSHKVQVWPIITIPIYYYDTFEGVAEKLPVGISVVQAPEKTVYFEGEALDTNGMTVKLSYNTEQEENITDYTVLGFDSNKVGKHILTVKYGEFTDTFEIEVMAKAIKAIEVTAPDKTEYLKETEELDLTGGKLKLVYNNGTSEEIDLTVDMVSGFDNTKAGKQTLTVTYGGFTDNFEIEIIDYISGDVNEDGKVDDQDAEYLLYHIFYPQQYPVRQDCDFNKDGSVDDKDAEYLLYHIFFPDAYPLDI